ncbi:MAG: N-acetylneuraminate synthase family protein [Brevinematia bacterium]
MYNVANLFNSKNPDVFIVAEIGINHGGSFDFAKKLVYSAKESGADAVKFQIFKTEKFYNQKILKENFDLFKSLELTFDQFSRLKELSDSLDMVFFATPLDTDSLDFLIAINTPIIKIASSDISCEPFLFEISKKAEKYKKAVFMSTGFVKMDVIKKAVSFFQNTDIALLYCVSKYPASSDDIDLNVIKSFKENFLMPVGFSDHTLNYIFSVGAVALGAKIIEKHFTTDNSLPGLDHLISLNPERFKTMVTSIREIEKALKTGEKSITKFEEDISGLSMREMYFSRDMKKGEKIKAEDILFLRPGTGVSLRKFRSRLNKKLKEDKLMYEKV